MRPRETDNRERTPASNAVNDALRSVRVTVVDLLGMLVPGFLIVAAVLVYPPVLDRWWSSLLAWSRSPELMRWMTWAVQAGLLLSAVVLGFVNRVLAIRLATRLSGDGRVGNLGPALRDLDARVEDTILDPNGWRAVEEVSKVVDGSSLCASAPRFHYLKRLLRASRPDLWEEAERLEAEVRLIGGLIIPLALLMLDALLYLNRAGAAIAMPAFFGLFACLALLLHWFPIRRAREVAYLYFLVMVATGMPATQAKKP